LPGVVFGVLRRVIGELYLVFHKFIGCTRPSLWFQLLHLPSM
jgi:hypothetical protein